MLRHEASHDAHARSSSQAGAPYAKEPAWDPQLADASVRGGGVAAWISVLVSWSLLVEGGGMRACRWC